MNLGDVIRSRRRDLHITQAQLAEIMGVHRVSIAQWERGDTAGIEAKRIVSLEKALNIDPGELFKVFYNASGA